MLSIFMSLLILLFFSNWGSLLIMLIILVFFFSLNFSEFSSYNLNLLFETDTLSSSLVILSFWIIILCFLGSMNIKNLSKSKDIFSFLLVILLLFLALSFTLSNYLMFYLSFECSLIPVLFMILGWGYQPERSQAGMYLMFYTLVASLPLLILIISDISISGWCMLISVLYTKSSFNMINFFYLLAFLVKFPMYITHLWLPKAHVEAPVAGSMILAGVLLKLGGYGVIRFLPIMGDSPKIVQSILISLSIWGGLMISLTCLCQMDMKALIAYSSVVHMSTCISGLLVMTDWGLKGCVALMVGHGLCSSGLFFMVGVVYERTNSRSLSLNKGLINLMPSLSLWWFLLLAANMAAPPTINLLAEISLIISLISWSSFMMIPLGLMTFFSAAYSLYLFSLSQHGKYILSKQGFHSGSVMEYMVLFFHWLPLNLFILSVFFII